MRRHGGLLWTAWSGRCLKLAPRSLTVSGPCAARSPLRRVGIMLHVNHLPSTVPWRVCRCQASMTRVPVLLFSLLLALANVAPVPAVAAPSVQMTVRAGFDGAAKVG